MVQPVRDTSVQYALLRSAWIGVVLGAAVVVLLLDNDSDVEVAVIGFSRLYGVTGTSARLVFAGMARLLAASQRRALREQHARELFLPEAVGLALVPVRRRADAHHRASPQRPLLLQSETLS